MLQNFNYISKDASAITPHDTRRVPCFLPPLARSAGDSGPDFMSRLLALRCRCRSTAATAGKALFFRSFSQSSRPPLSHSPASLQPFLDRQGTVILDGDLSTALGAESERHALSGAQHLFRLEGHNKLLDLHRTFLEAGSDVISSLSYQVSFEMFTAASTFTDGSLPGGSITAEKNQLGYSNDVLRTSVELAKKARNDFWSRSPAAWRGDGAPPAEAQAVAEPPAPAKMKCAAPQVLSASSVRPAPLAHVRAPRALVAGANPSARPSPRSGARARARRGSAPRTCASARRTSRRAGGEVGNGALE